ncbi:thioesterase II family protein [Streptomyces violaceusniger]
MKVGQTYLVGQRRSVVGTRADGQRRAEVVDGGDALTSVDVDMPDLIADPELDPAGWLWDVRRAPGPTLSTVVILPHAGGSAQGYRDWAQWFGSDVSVLAAQYPGRGPRYGEPPALSMEQLADPISEALSAIDTPLHIFGHSLGALLGFEVSWRLARRGRSPDTLYVSAASAAHIYTPGAHDPSQLDNAELIELLRADGGVPAIVLERLDLLDAVIGACRADMIATHRYTYGPARRILDCPMIVFGGDQDQAVPVPRLRRWPELTTGPSEVHVLNGGHFYVDDHLSTVTGAIRSRLPSSRQSPDGRLTEAP